MTLKLEAGHFLGQTVRTLELSGFRLTETIYAPGLKLPRHSHELAKYCFVLRGSFSETIGKHEHVRKPLALTFHPEDTTHAEAHHAAGHHFLIEVGTRWVNRTREYSAVLDRPAELPAAAAIVVATRLYEEFCRLDLISPLAIEGLMLELLAATSRCKLGSIDRRPPPWLEHVTDILRTRFSESLTLSDLSTAAGVHAVHLARVFRKFHGCTIGHFVRQLRIEYASRQLSSTETPLIEIAAEAGFSDQSHFCRVFKNYTRMLPSEFRAVFRPR